MTENEAIRDLKYLIEEYSAYPPETGVSATVGSLQYCITALKEIQQYREMDKKLREAYGDCDGLLESSVDLLCEHAGIDIGEPIKARLLTDENVDKWDAYQKIGTVEECRESVEKQKAKKVIIKPWKPSICPTCGMELSESLGDGYYKHWKNLRRCARCGQKIQWNENLEGMEDGTGQV